MKAYSHENLDTSEHDTVMRKYERFEEKCEDMGYDGVLGMSSKNQLQSAYLLEKPVTVLEISAPSKVVDEFQKKMSDYFFTHTKSDFVHVDDSEYHQLFVSLLQNLIKVVEEHVGSCLDEKADLVGILFGYNTKNVFGYCDDNKEDVIK